VRVAHADSCSGYGALAEGCGGCRVGLERGIERRQLRDAGGGLPWPDVSVHESRDGVACVRHSLPVSWTVELSARERVWLVATWRRRKTLVRPLPFTHARPSLEVERIRCTGSHTLAWNSSPTVCFRVPTRESADCFPSKHRMASTAPRKHTLPELDD
jgi:hypothetical protein